MATSGKRSAKKAPAKKAKAPPSKIVIHDPRLDASNDLKLRFLAPNYTFTVGGHMNPDVPLTTATAWDDDLDRQITVPAHQFPDFRIRDIPTVPGKRTCKVEVKIQNGPRLRKVFDFLAMPTRLLFSMIGLNVSNTDGCITCQNANRAYHLELDTTTDVKFWKGTINPTVCTATVTRLDLKITGQKTNVTLNFLPDTFATNYLVQYHVTNWNYSFPIKLDLVRKTGCKGWPNSIKVYPA